MRVFINKETGVTFDVEDDKADWFLRDADFAEVFDMPKEVVIKPKVKNVTVKKAKVSKRVLKKDKK